MPNSNKGLQSMPIDKDPDHETHMKHLEQKWRAVLVGAAYHTESVACLVVPAAGCGVLGNDASEVGATLGRLLAQEFAGRFDEVVVVNPGGRLGDEFAKAVQEAHIATCQEAVQDQPTVNARQDNLRDPLQPDRPTVHARRPGMWRMCSILWNRCFYRSAGPQARQPLLG